MELGLIALDAVLLCLDMALYKFSLVGWVAVLVPGASFGNIHCITRQKEKARYFINAAPIRVD